ncbi:MAG: molybdenum cofactor biosynthesis protein [Solirubrobacterales bacterium]
MLLNVRLFAGLREAAGADSVEVEVGPDSTAATLVETLKNRPGVGELLERMPVRVAVNMTYVDGGTVLREGDEIALVPPISGGAPIRARVTDQPLDIAALSSEAGDPAAGAVVVFQGVTREVSTLEYEAYREMAEKRIEEILLDCVERLELTAAIAEHRTGSVPLGAPSVIVAVSAPHRPEAFEGAREVIDRIKSEVPIWKVEVETDGSATRVAGELPDPDPVGSASQPRGQR